jgi:proteic killer suppression protein
LTLVTQWIIILDMIKTFKSKETEQIWNGVRCSKIPFDIQKIGRRKLRMLNNSKNINDLRIPPSNKLESLKGSRKGQRSIRINDKWRICFVWSNSDCYQV